ncbi:MAG: proteasome-activating nucleotidase [Candidatus Woesearchaeota archaeon]
MATNKTNTPNSEMTEIMYSYNAETNQLEQENRILRETVTQLKNELDKFRAVPLMVCEIKEIQGENAIIKIPNGNQFFVNIANNCEKLSAGDNVLVEQRNLTVLKKIDNNKRFNVEKYVIMEKPTTQWSEVGGLEPQIRDIKEVIELPLLKPELFKKVGITPPKGVLLHGPPGTGKTLLAKAVAASTNSTFIEIVGSELVQKFIGEGAKLVKEIFQLAREKAPTIIFIDEIDALAATRVELGTSGEREVQRTFMQFLAEFDGFKNLGNVKVIGCTNRMDILDPAILRPGRFDRLIEVPNPNEKGIFEILKIHTKNMKLNKGIELSEIAALMNGFSGAEVKAVCTEAGYFTIRSNRFIISKEDFTEAIKKVKTAEEDGNFLKAYG